MSDQTQPTVEKKSIFPVGNIPQNRKNWALLAIAVLIVGAVIFTGAGSPPAKATAKAAATTPPPATSSATAIAEATKQLQAETEQLRAAQLRAEQAKAQFDAQAKGMAAPGASPPGYPGQPYYPQQAAVVPPPPPPDPVAEDRKKREYASLYASNVALSYRQQDKRAEAPHQVEKAEEKAVTPPVVPATVAPPPAGGYKLFEGTIIETALQNQLEGSFVGPVTCLVTTDVYSHDRQHLLIPRGTRILGSSEAVQDSDQRRLAVVLHRMIMPDGYSVDFAQVATGLDAAGATALKDKVNNHWFSTFATSVALGAIAGFSLQGTGSFYSADGEDMYRQSMSRQLGQDSRQILQKQLNRVPEITIRPGHRVKVWLAKDILLPAYDAHPRVPGV